MMTYRIDHAGRPWRANIEVEEQDIILQSRGGSTDGGEARNPDYEGALHFICERLTGQLTLLERVLIDSASTRRSHPDPEDRVLVERDEIVELPTSELIARIRSVAKRFGQAPGVKGGNSTKQLRFVTNGDSDSLIRILNLRQFVPDDGGGRTASQSTERVRRLTSEQQRRVGDTHIKAAIRRLLAGEDAPNFRDSRDYDLITPDGERLAPKKVFGLALQEADVVEEAFPGHFSAGWSQPSFELLQAAGHSILRKPEAEIEAERRRRAKHDRAETDQLARSIEIDPEERSWIEGDKRMAGHLRSERKRSTKAAAAKRASIRAANNGRLVCEHCPTDWYSVYPDTVAEAIFDVHHTIPLSQMDAGHETSVDDLVCLCSNCHRAEHRRMALNIPQTVPE